MTKREKIIEYYILPSVIKKQIKEEIEIVNLVSDKYDGDDEVMVEVAPVIAKAGSALAKGATAIGRGLGKGIKAAGEALKKGAEFTGKALVQGAKTTGNVIKKAARIAGKTVRTTKNVINAVKRFRKEVAREYRRGLQNQVSRSAKFGPNKMRIQGKRLDGIERITNDGNIRRLAKDPSLSPILISLAAEPQLIQNIERLLETVRQANLIHLTPFLSYLAYNPQILQSIKQFANDNQKVAQLYIIIQNKQ